MDLFICPICGRKLDAEIQIGECDEFCVNCDECGKYKLGKEFYDDFIDNIRGDAIKIKVYEFLQSTKNEKKLYWITEIDNKDSEYVRRIPYTMLG